MLAIAVLAGCAGAPAPEAQRLAGPVYDPPLAELLLVASPVDRRPLGPGSRIRRGWLAFLPLVPHARQQVSPERVARDSNLLGYDFRVDLADAVARDLAASRVATTVARQGLAGSSGELSEGSYLLSIEIEQGVWHRNVTAYGLSFAGMALWLLGAPNSFGSVELALAAELRDEQGRSLGRARLRAEEPVVEQVYRGPFWDALRAATEQLLPELRRFAAGAIRAARTSDAIR